MEDYHISCLSIDQQRDVATILRELVEGRLKTLEDENKSLKNRINSLELECERMNRVLVDVRFDTNRNSDDIRNMRYRL